MILRFEDVSAGERTVRPLEFHSLETERAPQQTREGFVGVAEESEVRWAERVAALEVRLRDEAEVSRRRVEEAAREAELLTREEVAAETDRHIAEARAEVALLVEGFTRERARYFREAEAEVVSLALAIAQRVLHREALLDPMLLRAAVRVALDKVAGESGVTLRVPPEQVEAWRAIFAAERGDEAVTVTADRLLAAGDAVLETAVGRVELGVREQLKEIERGFFDLLEKRPA